jgi:hypothetical protein
MADMIGNAATSANSTPLSYEMVTMSPEKDEQKTRQEEEVKIPRFPDIQDWRSAIQQEPGLQITVAKGASPREGEAKTTDLGESGACSSGRKPMRVEQTADEQLEALLRQSDRPKAKTPQTAGMTDQSDGEDVGPMATVPYSSRRQSSRVRSGPEPEPISGPQFFRMDDESSTRPPSLKRSKSPAIESRPGNKTPPPDGDRLLPRTLVKEVNRDKRREDSKQELDKQRQLEKDAKIEALRMQSAATPAKADEGMEARAADTGGVSAEMTANALRGEAGALKAVGNATKALRQKDAELQKERQERTQGHSQLQAEATKAVGKRPKRCTRRMYACNKKTRKRTRSSEVPSAL